MRSAAYLLFISSSMYSTVFSTVFFALFFSSASWAFLDTSSLEAAEAIYDIQVPGKTEVEKCFVLNRMPGVTRSGLKEEQALCAINLYEGSSTHEQNLSLYACPKVHNTSIAIEFYQKPPQISQQSFQKQVCALGRSEKKKFKDKNGYPKKLAKFKPSSPGVSTGSVLGYYQLAQFLKAAEVPAVVLRTVDSDTLLNYSLAGRYLTRKLGNSTLFDYYNNQTSLLLTAKLGAVSRIPDHYTAASFGLGLIDASFYRSSSNLKLSQPGTKYWNERQLTLQGGQVYGALSENPGNELHYSEISGTRPAKYRIDQFRDSSVYYPLIKDSRPVRQILASMDQKSAMQRLQGMQDTSGMLVLDFLFDQADRIGNIHYYNYYFYKKSDGSVTDISEKKFNRLTQKDATAIEPKELELLATVKESGYKIKVMLLKDNDGGFDLNTAKKYHLIAKVNGDSASYAKWKDNTELYNKASLVMKHINPDVYKGLVQLYNWVFNDPQNEVNIKAYFTEVLQLTESEYKTFSNNLLSLYRALYNGCKAGQLHLDLDTKNYFSDQPRLILASTPGVCEGQF